MSTTTSTSQTTTEPDMSSRRRRRGTWGRTVTVLVLVVGSIIAAIALWPEGVPARPYVDDSAQGRLTLCGEHGAVTSGSTEAPLAVSVTGENVPNTGEATLYAFQPRAGAVPEAWSGMALGAPAPYTRTARLVPLAGSLTLRQFIGGYPALDSGYVELRLLVSRPGVGTSPRYDALDIHLDGDRWSAVGSGTSCPS